MTFLESALKWVIYFIIIALKLFQIDVDDYTQLSYPESRSGSDDLVNYSIIISIILYVHCAVDYPILYINARVWLWIVLVVIYDVLLLTAFGLLFHLLVFHIYLRTSYS